MNLTSSVFGNYSFLSIKLNDLFKSSILTIVNAGEVCHVCNATGQRLLKVNVCNPIFVFMDSIYNLQEPA